MNAESYFQKQRTMALARAQHVLFTRSPPGAGLSPTAQRCVVASALGATAILGFAIGRAGPLHSLRASGKRWARLQLRGLLSNLATLPPAASVPGEEG